MGQILMSTTTYVGIRDGLDTWEVRDDTGKLIGFDQSLPNDPPTIPDTVTAVQIRLWLVAHGIGLDQVDAAIVSLPDETREATRIEWEYSATIHRSSSMLAQMATAFGMDGAAIDAAFVEAAGL
jgi:hypothetical protein